MPHVLTITLEVRNGATPRLECTEPAEAACHEHPANDEYAYPHGWCSIVEAFEWDTAASMEGYQGPSFDVSKFTIEVTEITDEGEFNWQLAGREPQADRP